MLKGYSIYSGLEWYEQGEAGCNAQRVSVGAIRGKGQRRYLLGGVAPRPTPLGIAPPRPPRLLTAAPRKKPLTPKLTQCSAIPAKLKQDFGAPQRQGVCITHVPGHISMLQDI